MRRRPWLMNSPPRTLVLVSREDVRLAIETALRDEYAELEDTQDDSFRKRVDVIARATFTELERSA
jgi:hypothetical protein